MSFILASMNAVINVANNINNNINNRNNNNNDNNNNQVQEAISVVSIGTFLTVLGCFFAQHSLLTQISAVLSSV